MPDPVTDPAAPVSPAAPAPAASPATPAKLPIKTLDRKTYPTRVPPRFESMATAQRATDKAAQAAAPAPAPINPEAAKAPEAAPVAATPEGQPAQAEAPPAAEPAKVTETELARRLARLHRTDKKVTQREAEVKRKEGEQAAWIERAKMVQQAASLPPGQRLAFLKRAFGYDAQTLIDEVIGETARKPEEKNASELEQVKAKLANYENILGQFAEQAKREREAKAATDYMRETIAPIVANSALYLLAKDEHGGNLPQVIYDIQLAKWRKTGKAPSPKEVADFLEKSYREAHGRKSKLLGQNVEPQKAGGTSGTEPSRANAGSQTRSPATTSPVFRRHKGKPYVTKVVSG